MPAHSFEFRLSSLHGSPELDGCPPRLERLSDAGIWEVQQPDLSTPPFRLLLISLLLCMRFHLIQEARERQIPLRELQAAMTAELSEPWDLEGLWASFRITLDPAASDAGRQRLDAVALDAIRSRMERSPVVRNLTASCDFRLDVAVAA